MLQLIFAGTKRPTDPVHQAASAAVSQRDYQLLSKKKRRNLHLLQSWFALGTRPVLEGGSFQDKVQQNDGGADGVAHVVHVMGDL